MDSLEENLFPSVSDHGNSKKTIDDFDFVEKSTKTGPSSELGRGAYGVVRLVRERETNK